MKNKSNLLIIGLIGALFLLGINLFFINLFNNSDKEKLIMSITDVSKKCLSNRVQIYSNDKYRVYSSTNDKLIKKGNLNYNQDFNILIDKIKTYEADNKAYMNYKIILNNNEVIYASIEYATELNELLDLIPLNNLFECE